MTYKSRRSWAAVSLLIIMAGIASRLIQTGWIVSDKYLGDALYAAMVYSLLSIIWRASRLNRAAVSMTIMTLLELFQLTMIPAHMLHNPHLAVHLAARLLGTEFSFLDLLTYALGIGAVFLLDGS